MYHLMLWIIALTQPQRSRSHESSRRSSRGERGAQLVETGLLLTLIFLVALVSIRLFGTRVSSTIHNNAAAL